MTSPARAVLCSSLHSSGAKDALALGGFSFDCAAWKDTHCGHVQASASIPEVGRADIGSRRRASGHNGALSSVKPEAGIKPGRSRPITSVRTRADELGHCESNVIGDCSHEVARRGDPAPSINDAFRAGFTRLSHADCAVWRADTSRSGSHRLALAGASGVVVQGIAPHRNRRCHRAGVASGRSPQSKDVVVSIPHIFIQTRQSGQR